MLEIISLNKEEKTRGRVGKGREGKGRDGKGREGKGREGNGREEKGRERSRTKISGVEIAMCLTHYSRKAKWADTRAMGCFVDVIRGSVPIQ